MSKEPLSRNGQVSRVLHFQILLFADTGQLGSLDSEDEVDSRTPKQSSSKVCGFDKLSMSFDMNTTGQSKIEQLANDMGLGVHIKNGARRFFGLAVDNKFNRGRKSEYIIASCLYLQCRLQNDPHMLIDLSERLRVSHALNLKKVVDEIRSTCMSSAQHISSSAPHFISQIPCPRSTQLSTTSDSRSSSTSARMSMR